MAGRESRLDTARELLLGRNVPDLVLHPVPLLPNVSALGLNLGGPTRRVNRVRAP